MKIIFFANTDWYLYNFRLPFACFLRDHGHEVVMLSPPGPYVVQLQTAGFRALTVPMERRSLNPFRELALFHQIYRLYSRERPDLAHHFTIKCVVYGAFAARLAGVPACVNAVTGLGHVFTSEGATARLLRPPVRVLLQLALGGARSRLIVQNPDDQAIFEGAGLIAPARIRLIRGSGVDTKRFQPQGEDQAVAVLRQGGIQQKTVTVLLASRLLWEKGIGEYVAAARLLAQEGLAISFLLAGEPDPGNPASISAEQLDQWRCEGVVALLGHVDDMTGLLAQIDIAVLPSYREGVPRSLLEAAACGLPLVATDVPGCREIVEHQGNGLLVPVRDAVALAGAIGRLCHNPEMRMKMGVASRRKILAEFDQRIVFEKTLSVYKEIGRS